MKGIVKILKIKSLSGSISDSKFLQFSFPHHFICKNDYLWDNLSFKNKKIHVLMSFSKIGLFRKPVYKRTKIDYPNNVTVALPTLKKFCCLLIKIGYNLSKPSHYTLIYSFMIEYMCQFIFMYESIFQVYTIFKIFVDHFLAYDYTISLFIPIN
ncbi:hypothetical protein BpHYR1_033924 [Brachionus plicatilis]|uniref:Uncharacterized protein n=1 Tax=Brachionus plicatilis TaxID=10195 RepID=A0A3M7SDP3_BRAPC|nr:hypothetical protein BpHYR1_033924 [Brachionus plicatilis]